MVGYEVSAFDMATGGEKLSQGVFRNSVTEVTNVK